jgi:hypothetical protein
VSRSLRSFVVFGFASVHDCIAAESTLLKAGIDAVTIPSPREIGGLCGIALRCDPALAGPALAALETAGQTPIASAEITDY